ERRYPAARPDRRYVPGGTSICVPRTGCPSRVTRAPCGTLRKTSLPGVPGGVIGRGVVSRAVESAAPAWVVSSAAALSVGFALSAGEGRADANNHPCLAAYKPPPPRT